MTFNEALEFLRDLQWFGARFGLETSRRLAALFGHPEDRLRFVHVAGTNGKGSTCAMLESVYRKAGLRVGLYTSPHLIRIGERIQVNREPISDAEVAALARELKEALAGAGHPVTFFEALTIMALRHFEARKCDVVIWETGLGGRLDATNIVTPLASVITNAQFDHEKWLGNTLGRIAFEKAGIIKPFRPVITGAAAGEARETILRVAGEMRAPVTLAEHPGPFTARWPDAGPPLPGAHQWQNAAVALATLEVLQREISVPAKAVEEGMRDVDWPGRFQILERGEGRKMVLDGAHNPDGMRTLRAALEDFFPGRPLTVVLGAMEDKDWPAMCRVIAPLAGRMRVAPTGSERGASVEKLERACKEANPGAEVTRHASIEEALGVAGDDEVVVVTGSLHLVGAALEWARPERGGEHAERGLNDWTPRKAKG